MSWLAARGPRIVAVLGLAFALLYVASVVHVARKGPRRTDFIVVYAASQVCHRTTPAKAYDGRHLMSVIAEEVWPEIDEVWPWIYPPTALFLVWPLALLGYGAAQAAWLLLHLAVYLGALARLMPGRHLWLHGLAFPGVVANIAFCQNGMLTAGLLAGGCALLETAPAWGGAVLALACYKPHLGVLAPVLLLAAGQRRALAGYVAANLIWIGASVLVFGMASWQGWVHQLTGHVDWYRSTKVPLELVTTWYSWGRMLGLPGVAALALQGLVSLAALALTVDLWWRREDTPSRVATLILGTLTIIPKVVVYDLALLGPVMAAWLAMEEREPPVFEKLLLAVCWILPVAAAPLAARTGVSPGALVPLVLLVLLHRREDERVVEA